MLAVDYLLGLWEVGVRSSEEIAISGQLVVRDVLLGMVDDLALNRGWSLLLTRLLDVRC